MSGDRELNPPSRDWERLYTAAVLEPDRSKLKSRIDPAQAAIDSRLQEMDSDHGGTAAERLEIETAQAALEVFRKGWQCHGKAHR